MGDPFCSPGGLLEGGHPSPLAVVKEPYRTRPELPSRGAPENPQDRAGGSLGPPSPGRSSRPPSGPGGVGLPAPDGSGQDQFQAFLSHEHFAPEHLRCLSAGGFAIVARPEVGEEKLTGPGC